MDTTQLLYLAGAFLLGFFFAWFAGRSGPKHALEECEANAHSLQRSLDDRSRAVTKLESQLKEQSAQVDSLGAEREGLTTRLATAELGFNDTGAELALVQQQLADAQSERLRLEAELGHMRGAYADTRTRLAAFVEEADAAAAARAAEDAAEEEAEAEAAEAAEAVADELAETITALAVAEADQVAELDRLNGQVQSLETELSAARAALSRMSAQVALRPELTSGKRLEYAALSGDPERIVAALHERDIAVADARNEVDYLRRTIGMLTAMGAELAGEVERRRREQQLLVYQVAGLNAVTRNIEMKQLTDSQAKQPASDPGEPSNTLEANSAAGNENAAAAATAVATDLRSQLDERTKELEELKTQSDPLQANLDELQAEIEALNAVKADLEAQLEVRDTDLTETKDRLATLQTEAEGSAAAKAALEERVQVQSSQWDDLLARITALNAELSVISAAEGEEAPVTAPSDEVAALAAADPAPESGAVPEAARAADAAVPVETEPNAAPAEESPASAALAKLSAGVAAALALLKRKNDRLAEYEQQVQAIGGEKSTLESTVAAKDQALVSTQGKVSELQSALSQRSARFDALSMHASSLEATMEIEKLDRSKLEEQVRAVAGDLQALVQSYATNGAAEVAEVADATAAPETSPEAVPAEGGDAVEASSAPAATEQADAAAAVSVPELSTVETLSAGAAAVTELVRSKQAELEGAKTQLASLQEELAAYTAARDALAAELESRGLNLSDVQAKLQELQGQYSGEQSARGDLETRLQAIDQKLQSYLAEYGDAGDGTLQVADAAAVPAAMAPAGADGTLADASPSPVATGEAAGETTEAKAPAVQAAGVLAGLVAVGDLLKRGKDALEGANARIGELEDEIGALTSQTTDLQSQIEQKEQAIVDLTAQLETAQADIASRTLEVETLTHQLESVQATLTASEAERQRLDAQLHELDADLWSLGEAWDAGDEETLNLLAEKLGGTSAGAAGEASGEAAGEAEEDGGRAISAPLLKTAGAVAVVGAIQKKQSALKETSAQLEALQQEQEGLAVAKTDLETQLQAQTAALEEAKANLEALQQQFDTASAQHGEEVQTFDQKSAELQAKYNEAEAARLQLQAQLDELAAEEEAAKALLAERDSTLQEVETKLVAVSVPADKTVSDFKASARAAAQSRGVEARSTTELQDLAELKHIGVTFEQRLYRAGAGTFWEVAHLTNDDFELILRLTEMQQLAMNMDEVRSDAERLAQETGTVGLLSEGETPDDFEPIQGIGKIFEQRLYSAGIRTYRQLAATSEERLAEICQARKPLVPDYSSWIRQARIFVEVRESK